MRKPFSLVKRASLGKNKPYYAKIWDEESYDYYWKSIRTIKTELGKAGSKFPHTSKAGAEALVRLWLETRPKYSQEIFFIEYLEDFWKLDSDFAISKKNRGKALSVKYIESNASGIKNHFKPFLEATKKEKILLAQVKPALLESFLTYQTDKGKISNRRINGILQAVKVSLSEAARLGLIDKNPGESVRKLSEEKTYREIFTIEEAQTFLKNSSYGIRFQIINLLAATTGMRQGECLGLLHSDVKEGSILITHNFQKEEGVKAPKHNSVRAVPVPEKTMAALKSLIAASPFGDGFVFWGSTAEKPMNKDDVSKTFRTAVIAMGITEEERVRRNLTFHSWRHFYNTRLRGEVPDHVLRELTGHKNEEMTEVYSAVTDEQRKAVSDLADKIL